LNTIAFDDFEKVDIRVGTVVEAEEFPRARKPLYRLKIDFGPEVGIRQSAAGLPGRYELGELVGRQVIAVLNLGVRNIAGFESQCLTLGLPDEENETILLSPTRSVPNGGRLF
jgi:tRNA-binding protein